MTWDAFSALVTLLAEEVARDGLPEVIVGILRGGMVPAVMLAHRWGLRVVRGLDVVHTLADGVDAAKAPNPVVRDQDSLGDLGGMNVLVVDDVAGSGQTVATAREMVAARGADRVRTLACVVNEANWPPDAEDPAKVLTYLGRRQRGWVIFPWESP
ncbi:MAG: purine phosphoribosyltransferase [Actinobacteria bacterium]|nr:purine phosphoribosyltransferase [Actinomycetota bacterium]MBI3686019.1 purine phosphoribosyltransferase [Actinomycetota bacterium]